MASPNTAPSPGEVSGAALPAKLKASCHCGRVSIELPSPPDKLNECRCTVCYKYGALWAYFPRDTLAVATAEGGTVEAYVRADSDGYLSFNRCGHCGGMTHWLGLGEYAGPKRKAGVNCRLLPEKDIEGIPREVNYC